MKVLVGERPLFQALGSRSGVTCDGNIECRHSNTRGRGGGADKLSTVHRLAVDRAFSVW